jgi:hypothetical protein
MYLYTFMPRTTDSMILEYSGTLCIVVKWRHLDTGGGTLLPKPVCQDKTVCSL